MYFFTLKDHGRRRIEIKEKEITGENKGPLVLEGRKEGNVLFNDALNTFYLRLYSVGHMVKNHSDSERGNFQLAAMVLLYAPSHRQDSTYHSL